MALCSHLFGGHQVNLLLERPCRYSTGDASVREASKKLRAEVVAALLHKLERVSVKTFKLAIAKAVQSGHMELFTALVTNVASDLAARDDCLSRALKAACERVEVRFDTEAHAGGAVAICVAFVNIAYDVL